jgi:DNA polymerase V
MLRVGSVRVRFTGNQDLSFIDAPPMTTIDSIHPLTTAHRITRPLYLSRVRAGQPEPTEDDIDEVIDLNEHLIKHPEETYFVRVEGYSMADAGIGDGDVLIVDRHVEADDGDIVIAALDGELTVKRLRKRDGGLFLQPENDGYSAIPVSEANDLVLWGVVRHVIRRLS